jgi:broad specificity phosphatase PhoE
MPVRIHLLRHGETDEDKSDNPKFSGPGAIPLNDAGVAQMKEAAAFFKKAGIKPSLLLSSPIARAYQSAQIIGEALGVNPRPLVALKDWKIGAAAGITVSRILPFVLFFERNPDLMIPATRSSDGRALDDSEPYAKFWDRSGIGLKYLLDLPYEDADVIAATHSRFIATARMRIVDGKGMEPTDFLGSPKPGGTVKIEKQPNGSYSFELTHGTWNGETR